MKHKPFSILRLKRSWIYRPLAGLLVLLMLPMFSGWTGQVGLRAFQAAADPIDTTNTIIQNYCVGSDCYTTDLAQLELDAVNAYLGLHKIPSGDVHIIYDYGREDLRNAIRGLMFDILSGVIATPASERTTHQQNLLNWFQALVQKNELQLATQARNQFNSWLRDPCHFVLDADIASRYGLSYDGAPFCYGGTLTGLLGGGPTVPAESYFTTYGFKQSYGAPALTNPDFGSLVTGAAQSVQQVAAMSAVAAAPIWVGAEVLIAPIILQALQAYLVAQGQTIASVAGIVGNAGAVLSAVGAAAIIVAAIAIGVSAGMQQIGNALALETTQKNLTDRVAHAQNAPDLGSFLADTTGLGGYKLLTTFVAQTGPDPSASNLPAHIDSDLNFAIQKPSALNPTISPTLSYQDWNKVTWSTQTSGGWFVQSCQSGKNCPRADGIIADIQFLDEAGARWTAARFGEKFIVSKGTPPVPTDLDCKPDPISGVTPDADFSKCRSYVATSIVLQAANGDLQRVSLSVLKPPVFENTASTSLPFTQTVQSIQNIRASGNPIPTICFKSSNPALPSDFTLDGAPLNSSACAEGMFPLAFNGNPDLPDQSYQLTLTATIDGTSVAVDQAFTVDLSQHLGFTSSGTVSGTAGIPANFLVTATGNPPPALRVDQQLLDGLPGISFTDHGEGTGTFSGITPFPALGYFATCGAVTNPDGSIVTTPCGVHATNTQGTILQRLEFNFSPPPAAILGPPQAAKFTAGVANSLLLTSTGAPITSVYWVIQSAPDWLKLTDNKDGTATLSGTPPLGTNEIFNPLLTPVSLGNIAVLSNYPIHVEDIPVFLSPNSAAFTVGESGKFLVRANQGSISLIDQLPPGLSYVPGDSLQCLLLNGAGGCLMGTPSLGTGGQYTVTFNDDAGALGQASQSFRLNIYEEARITSPNSATFFTGKPGAFQVTTTGHPSLSVDPVPPGSSPPGSPEEGKGMYFTVTGLPSGLTFSNLSPEGLATGVLTIQGIPTNADVGLHQVNVTAQNGAGAVAAQTLELDVIGISGPAPESGRSCNGAYDGTYKGSLSVSAGQSCMFVGGRVTGNIRINGGSVSLNNTNVGGNVSIRGAAAIYLGAGTTIGGSVTIQGMSSGVSTNQICGTTVAGDVVVAGNATSLQIGSQSAACPGNAFGRSVFVTLNSAITSLYNNAISKNLSCSRNNSIRGRGNTVGGEKMGQCSRL